MKKMSFVTVLLLITLLQASAQKVAFDLKASVERGLDIYQAQCIACHMESGEGLDGAYPPLAKSDFLLSNKNRSITTVLNGLTGPIKVKGVAYDSEMIPVELSDQETSDVLNYVRNSWGNKGEPVKPEEIKALRK